MSVPEAVLEELRRLCPTDQQKVLEFIQSLRPGKARRDPRGLFAHRGIHIAAEEIADARREACANFPRDLPDGGGP